MKTIWDLGRFLFALGMALGGAVLLGMLAFRLFHVTAVSPMLSKLLCGLPFAVFAFFLCQGLMKLFGRFRQKCKNEWDFWMIMLSFSLAGMFIMPVRKLVFHLLGIGPQTPLWVKILVYIPLIPPTYYAGLLIIGSLLGQSSFFMGMIKSRLRFLTGRQNVKH